MRWDPGDERLRGRPTDPSGYNEFRWEKPQENGGLMVAEWNFMGFTWIYPLVNVYMAMENHHLSWESSLYL